MTYIDNGGYKRGNVKHSDLQHRQIAFKYIYQPNRDKYPLPFSQYQVHHIDGNKQNNDLKNLKLVTQDSHEQIHETKKDIIETREICELYWTGRGLSRFGIISLTEKGIKIYYSRKILALGPRNLKEAEFASIDFKDIMHITAKIGLAGLWYKQINIFLTDDAFQREMNKQKKIIQKIAPIINSQKVISLEVNMDTKDKILSFVKKANVLLKISK